MFTTARHLSHSWARSSPHPPIYALVIQISLASCTAPKPCMYFSSPCTTCSSHSILLKCMTQSLTTYWKFHFKFSPSSMTVSGVSSSIQVFWKICFAHLLHPFYHVLLVSYFLIWSTHWCILNIHFGIPHRGTSSILPVLPNFGSWDSIGLIPWLG